MDLSKLSAKELDELASQALSLAQKKREEEKTKVRQDVLDMIKSAGFTFEELFEAAPKDAKPASGKTKKPMAVKYRDPANPKNTWTGVGRPAKWIAEYEALGRKREEFAVK